MSDTVQIWLDTKYQDKNSSGKIELYDRTVGDSEELIGELMIENYTNIEEISFTRWGKKGKITKVTITNCPRVKKMKFDNNEIMEIIFKDDLPNLEWLDLPDNKLKEIDVSLTPNLRRLHMARNPDLVKVKGLENLTKLETVNLLETPGLNGQEFKQWKERPTKEELAKAVTDKANEFKDYINPNDKAKLEEAAKGQGMVPKNEFDGVKNELGGWKDKFPGKKPEQVEKEIKDLQSKPTTGGSGTGAALTPEQQQKLNDYEKLEKQKKWLLRYLEKQNSEDQYAEILQDFNEVK